MRIHLLQWDTIWEDPTANFEAVVGLLDGAGEADLIVLPELFATGFTLKPESRVESPGDGPTWNFLRQLAIDRSVHLVGSRIELEEGRPQNTVLVFDPSGTCMARYAKIHPFSYSGEDRHYAPGTSLAFFPAGGFEIGLAICYDLRFPELFRTLSSRGVDLFLVPANWPTRRREHWLTLLRARAIENLAYVVGVNRTGEGGGLCYPGASIVYGPFGEIVGEAGSEAQLLTVELDPAEVGRIRSSYPFLQDAKGTLWWADAEAGPPSPTG